MDIKKVCINIKSGQVFITLPRQKYQKGDYVIVEKCKTEEMLKLLGKQQS